VRERKICGEDEDGERRLQKKMKAGGEEVAGLFLPKERKGCGLGAQNQNHRGDPWFQQSSPNKKWWLWFWPKNQRKGRGATLP
jgi:hypothetical protein